MTKARLNFGGCIVRNREFGHVSSHIRQAIGQWRDKDVRRWVAIAELELSGSQLSRTLFGETDDHMEIKVTGFGKSISVVLPEAASLEQLAEMVLACCRTTDHGQAGNAYTAFRQAHEARPIFALFLRPSFPETYCGENVAWK